MNHGWEAQLNQQTAAIKPRGTGVRAMLETLADVVIEYDDEGRILWCNQQLCTLMECEASELIGKVLPELGIDIPPPSTLHRNGNRTESVVHTAHGLRWFIWSDVNHTGDDGLIRHFAVARDITAVREREAALIQARERAEQASLEKSRLLATVSHEIRTPMSGVIGMAGLLSFTPLTPEQQTYIQAINTSAESLIKLVNELLDFSRIEAGRLLLEPQRVNIRELIEGVVELLAVNAFEKDLGIGAHISPEVPDTFMVDPGRLRQILLNLVGNAIKMTDEGGVLVTAGCRKADEIVFTVEDTGPGMDQSTVSRLFREFEQSDDRSKRPEDGTGLGLAITRRLVVAMGGQVSVATAPGQGAIFTVQLPISDAEPSNEIPGTFDGLRVAILSPRIIEARALAMFVEARGGAARILESEAAAEAMLQEGRREFDVLVADASLEAQGEQMLRRLCSSGLKVRRALTLISPTDRARLPRLRANGYDAFIARPPRGRTVIRLLSGDLPTSPMQPTVDRTALRTLATGHQLNVLLAEDNKINALLTEKALRSAGCSVTTVTNGTGALEAFGMFTSVHDLMIVDLNLPDMSGLEVIERIRAQEEAQSGRRVPILVLSADGQESTREQALRCGATEFLQKPLDPALLLSLIAKFSEF